MRYVVFLEHLADFLNNVPKNFHGILEIISRCRPKYIHAISHHTFIKVTVLPVI